MKKKLANFLLVAISVLMISASCMACVGAPKLSKYFDVENQSNNYAEKAQAIELSGGVDFQDTFNYGADIVSYNATSKDAQNQDVRVHTLYDLNLKQQIPNIASADNVYIRYTGFGYGENSSDFYQVSRNFKVGESNVVKYAIFNRAGVNLTQFEENKWNGTPHTIANSNKDLQFFGMNGNIYRIEGEQVNTILEGVQASNFSIQNASYLVENHNQSYVAYDFSGNVINSIILKANESLLPLNDKNALILSIFDIPQDSKDYTFIDPDGVKTKVVYEILTFKNLKRKQVKLDYILRADTMLNANEDDENGTLKDKKTIYVNGLKINKDKTVSTKLDLLFINPDNLQIKAVLENTLNVNYLSNGNYLKSTAVVLADKDISQTGISLVNAKGKTLAAFKNAYYDANQNIIIANDNGGKYDLYDIDGKIIPLDKNYTSYGLEFYNGFTTASKIENGVEVNGFMDKTGAFTKLTLPEGQSIVDAHGGLIFSGTDINNVKSVYAYGKTTPIFTSENMFQLLTPCLWSSSKAGNMYYSIKDGEKPKVIVFSKN